MMYAKWSKTIGGFNQRQGEGLPPQIFLTLSRFVFTDQTRKMGSVYYQENYRNCCHPMSDFKAKKAPNSMSAGAPLQMPLGGGSSQRSPKPPADLIPTLGPPGLETICLPKYVSLNPPMHNTVTILSKLKIQRCCSVTHATYWPKATKHN